MPQRETPLHDAHADSGASFTDFGGWDMPVEFDSIRTEHAAVRESAGKFDVSHMGEIAVSGPDAAALMQRLVTNDVERLDPGEALYAAIVDPKGIMLDDTIVYRPPEEGNHDWLFVPNAGHDGEMYDRWQSHRDEWGLDATVENVTESYGMIALQGPDSESLLAAETDADLAALGHNDHVFADVAGVESMVARGGYTGEDGFELLVPWDEAGTVWSALDCQPCGLGARDTLRLEMGFLLSGQEFDPESEPRTPYEAGIGWTVALDTPFVGRDALERVDAEGVAEELVGVEMIDRGIPRHGYDLRIPGGDDVGHLTSGTMSPTLGRGIGLGYVGVDHADPGTEVRVVVRGEPKKARITVPPFLDR
ncbi:glycine cleavage system protein T [Halobacteriales archaeon QS_1_68_17]|nr:MAG: glycine cleavage system protein T [Halobacteriales archaeon QS_1_68_17]